jgi:hypothetical protein
MGCAGSEPERRVRSRDANETGPRKERPSSSSPTPISPSACFDFLTQGVNRICGTSNMVPVVCLSRDAFPVITYSETSDTFVLGETSPPLPIIAGAISGSGRVLCFSQIQFLVKRFSEEGNKKLITNSLRWLSSCSTSMVQILGLGFEKSHHQGISHSLQDIGYTVEFHTADGLNFSSMKPFKILLIPSDLNISDDTLFDAIIEFTTNGGGLAVFFIMKQFTSMTVPINRLLLKFNLAYTLFILEEENDPAAPIPVPESYTHVRDVNLVPLLARFKATVKQSCVDEPALDDVVTALRCYVMVCDESRCEELEQLMEYSWDFLKRNGYSTPSGLCPDVAHSTVALLLFDLSNKLPPSKVQPFPEHSNFPGDLSAPMTSLSIELTLPLELEIWRSTGLWLSAGTLGIIECDEPQPDVLVQIGAHTENLICKQGPWLRWPLVATLRPLDSKRTEIATSFGGIVYVSVSIFAQNAPPPVTLRFEGFVKHPAAPWGEIIAGGAIFTLPTRELIKLNVKLIDQKFALIIEEMRRFLGTGGPSSFRFVFDIELAAGDCVRYPLVFLVDDVPGILNHFEEPCAELFKAVQLMANGSIKENCLDQQTEEAVATIAACVIFQKLFPEFDPFEFPAITLPALFNDLWEIQRCCPKVIPETVVKVQQPGPPPALVPDDMWIMFVRELCTVGQLNFTRVLEKSRPIPLNILQSLQGLPPFSPR